MRRVLPSVFLAGALLPAPSAHALELEIEFRYQPDKSRENTVRKSVNIDDGRVEINENGKRTKREISSTETAELATLVEKRAREFRFADGVHIDPPRVEAIFEYDTRSGEIEVTEVYPAGKVPAEYVELQKRFFKEPIR